ncbi:MAG: DegT/DnrJ/EryC1/StrS family aminotransferase [Candidatus Omnitrophota bacterium]|jgi:dTDP-4-amino-4,6-dideoxygalactose transaminase|nr:MAG: DegT/DnrJ/EryC1/StrS family aminotransferase [Candidatus Omnitrophota bacterium]
MKRREFIQKSAAGAAVTLGGPMIISAAASERSAKPAALGGTAVRSQGFPSWPQIQDNDRESMKDVLEKKGWCRLNGDYVNTFEQEYAKLTGAKECLAVANGTSALLTSLNALGVGPGDEVIVPPYTFVATINVVLLQHALPIYVDTDRETFQIDAQKIEARITDKTKCIIPVHLGGNVADLDTILAIGKKHNIPVVEDACQAHLAEWKGEKVGTLGATGCFSFQVTKNLSGGEGGAVLCDDEELMDRCYSFHSNGRERTNKYGYGYIHNGMNARMTEFQGALLLQQMTRLEEQSKTREQNADYLTKQFNEIPGITPEKMYEGTTRNAYHLYMFRYDKEKFAGLPRSKFIEALNKEGISCGSGYSPLNKQKFMEETLYSRVFLNVYGKERIDRYFAENECPENDKLCNEEAVWFYQNMMLAEREAMDQIAEAIRKIQAHAGQIAKA